LGNWAARFLGLAPQAIQILPLRGNQEAPFDVTLEKVEVLAILTKPKAERWLKEAGEWL
jgi:hypothetical protein